MVFLLNPKMDILFNTTSSIWHQEVTANKLIDRMANHKDNWVDIIHSSFLPEELKSEYVAMIEQRVDVLMQNR